MRYGDIQESHEVHYYERDIARVMIVSTRLPTEDDMMSSLYAI